MTQQFQTADVVRLEIEEPWGDALPNLVENPTAGDGAWGWTNTGTFTSEPDRFALEGSPGRYALTRPYQIPTVAGPGTSIRAQATLVDNGAGTVSFIVEFLDEAAEVISTAGVGEAAVPYPQVVQIPTTDVPTDTRYLRIRVRTNGIGVSAQAYFNDVILITGPTADVAAATLQVSVPWTNVIGESNNIETERDELNVGTLRSVILSSTLDPAVNDLIRPGQRCRLRALIDSVWENLFFGELNDPSATYEMKDPSRPDEKRTVITIVAVDAAAPMANTPQPAGVGVVEDLPAVLLAAGVRWNLNGYTGTLDPVFIDVVAHTEGASVLDQVAITRDSVQGYAWVDRNGTVQVWDAALLPTAVVAELDEMTYSDVSIDFDLSKVFNAVVVKMLRINPGTGETEEITFGPYVDETSARKWRRRQATFTVQGVDEASIPALAQSILESNATPEKRINSVTLPLRTVAELEANATRDLYDLVETSNVRAGIVAQQSRVTSVKHRISAERGRGQWFVDLGFTTDGVVAAPQVTPSPTLTGGKTMAQLLRPVGEVTMWFGAKADIPAGWLPIDGTAIPAEYPDLIALVGPTLPDFTDRFPIGAGTKALGTTGGAPSVTLAANNLPPHVHGIARQTGANTGGGTNIALGNAVAGPVGGTQANTTTNDPVDILNPWLSLWFIIRAA